MSGIYSEAKWGQWRAWELKWGNIWLDDNILYETGENGAKISDILSQMDEFNGDISVILTQNVKGLHSS